MDCLTFLETIFSEEEGEIKDYYERIIYSWGDPGGCKQENLRTEHVLKIILETGFFLFYKEGYGEELIDKFKSFFEKTKLVAEGEGIYFIEYDLKMCEKQYLETLHSNQMIISHILYADQLVC